MQIRDRFPPGESQLARYAGVFNCAEINSSFHQPHRKTTYERWAATVPDDFRFSVKIPKEITHTKQCNDCYDDLARFLEETAALGLKRSVLLMQFPPKFEYDGARMEAFFSELRSLYEGFAVCEPRNASWFADDASALLQAFRIGRVVADPALNEGASEAGGWRGITYFRLHGAPRIYYSRYSDEVVAAVAERLSQDAARERWCIFDNTASGAATENALDLARIAG